MCMYSPLLALSHVYTPHPWNICIFQTGHPEGRAHYLGCYIPGPEALYLRVIGVQRLSSQGRVPQIPLSSRDHTG